VFIIGPVSIDCVYYRPGVYRLQTPPPRLARGSAVQGMPADVMQLVALTVGSPWPPGPAGECEAHAWTGFSVRGMPWAAGIVLERARAAGRYQ